MALRLGGSHAGRKEEMSEERAPYGGVELSESESLVMKWMHKHGIALTLDAAQEITNIVENAQEDTARLDWAEANPDKFVNRLTVLWATAGRGFREKFFGVRRAIDSAKEDVCE